MIKIISRAFVMLLTTTLLPAQQEEATLNTSYGDYIVGIVAACVGTYAVYDIGRQQGFWAYPEVDELHTCAQKLQEHYRTYQDIYAIFTQSDDNEKEPVLFSMAAHAQYRTCMQSAIDSIVILMRKLRGRLQALHTALPAVDQGAILLLEQDLAALQALHDAVHLLLAHSDKHSSYFKLYAAEQTCSTDYARELQLYARYHHDAEKFLAELITYSSYRYPSRYGLIVMRDRIRNARVTYGCLVGTYAQPYAHIKERFQEIVAALYAIENALESSAYFAELEHEYAAYLQRQEDAK